MRSINPTTLELNNEFREDTPEEIELKLRASVSAFLDWRETSFGERASLFFKMAEILRLKKNELAETSVREMGKPITSAVSEIEKCALVCEYYAENAEKFLKSEVVETEAKESYISFEPLGPILAVMPWNYPFWQVFRFVAPALMAGNVGVLKHASTVPECSAVIQKIFAQAGFPENVFQALFISGERTAGVIDDDRIMAVTLTGSEKAGSAVASIAGRAIKKTVLELGGSDPFI